MTGGQLELDLVLPSTERNRARRAVAKAIAAGELTRPALCSRCGRPPRAWWLPPHDRMHAHHDDYARPLDVRWLCAACHWHVHPGYDHDRRGTPARNETPGMSDPGAS